MGEVEWYYECDVYILDEWVKDLECIGIRWLLWIRTKVMWDSKIIMTQTWKVYRSKEWGAIEKRDREETARKRNIERDI